MLSHVANITLSTSGILVVAVAVVLTHGVIWLACLYLRYGPDQFFVRIFDPESHPTGSLWEAFGDAMRNRLRPSFDQNQGQKLTIFSPTHRYTVIGQLASGDLCDVHEAASRSRRFVLKIPRTAGCDQLLEKEQEVLCHLQKQPESDHYGKYFPVPVEAFRTRGRLVSALKWRDGFFTAEQIRDRHPAGVDARHLAWMFNRTLEALGFVHRHGWVHGAVHPPHLLFCTDSHAMQLVGWIHCEPVGTPLQVVSRRLKSWYPAECHRRRAATAATDIYLAAKSMIWLAGGNPHADRMPEHVPVEMAQFLKECLSLSPSSPELAWTLHEQFRELLEDLYGPPKFCHLNMS